MAKETYYFQHDYAPTDDLKIQAMLSEYGAAGYGLYWRIVETLHSDKSHRLPNKAYVAAAIANQMKSTADFVLQFIEDCVVKFELFQQDRDMIFSSRVDYNISKINDIREKRKAAGSKGGVANAKQMQANAKQNVAKEKKIKEKKEDISSHLVPPTREEFRGYFLANGFRVDVADRAYEYYSLGDWKDSQGKKVKNWKQKMQAVWFKDEHRQPNSQQQQPGKRGLVI